MEKSYAKKLSIVPLRNLSEHTAPFGGLLCSHQLQKGTIEKFLRSFFQKATSPARRRRGLFYPYFFEGGGYTGEDIGEGDVVLGEELFHNREGGGVDGGNTGH